MVTLAALTGWIGNGVVPGMADADARPIIIKKIKKGGHGHHGGAWKVAYADFVTAMMAFFLLLWLLSTSSEEQLTGLADYFSPTAISTSSQSGAGGILGGKTLSTEGASVGDRTPMGITVSLTTPEAETEEQEEEQDVKDGDSPEEQPDREIVEREQERFKKAEEELRQAIEATPGLAEHAANLMIDQTEEGLRIQIVDQQGSTMFRSGSAEPEPQTIKLLELVAAAVKRLPNEIVISGHTDSTPFKGRDDYGNWELSTDRANASRRILANSDLPAERIARVSGKADTELLLPEEPNSPQNRRVSIIVLNHQSGGNLEARAKAEAEKKAESEKPAEPEVAPSIIRRDSEIPKPSSASSLGVVE